MTAIAKLSGLAKRLDAATPPHRDRAVDALRALAIAGVILGHWLVTALVVTKGAHGPSVHDASPLATLPLLVPASWVFQTLAIFFLVAGYSAAASFRGGYRAWLVRRMARLSRPVAFLAAIWTLVAAGLLAAGVSWPTLHVLLTLVLDPLWFLGVFALLTAATPVAVGLVRRLGAWAALIPLSVVAGIDLVRFGLGELTWLGWVNVVAGWMVPYLLGIAWARGAFASRRVPAIMLGGGVAATAALIVWAGYPASMVGVNGAPQPADPGGRDFRRRASWPRLAAARPARQVDAALGRLGSGGGRQHVGDDVVPVAPDRVHRCDLGRVCVRPTAGFAHGPVQPDLGRGAARLAPGVRRRARRPVGRPPARRAAATPARSCTSHRSRHEARMIGPVHYGFGLESAPRGAAPAVSDAA